MALTYLGKCDLARIGDHSQCRDGLFLDVSFDGFACFGTRVKQLEQSFNDGVEVRKEYVPFNAFAKVDQRGGRVCMDAVRDKSAVSLQVEYPTSFTEVQGLRVSVSTQQRVVDGNHLE